MRRLLFNTFVAASLLLLITSSAMWMRSYWITEKWESTFAVKDRTSSFRGRISREIHSSYGSLGYGRWTTFVGKTPDTRWLHQPESEPAARGDTHHWLVWSSHWNLEGAKTFAGFIWHRRTKSSLFSVDPKDFSWIPAGWSMVIPYWFPTLLFTLPPLLWMAVVRRRRNLKKTGLCPTCGYDLRATPDRCPECGMTSIKLPS